MKLFFTADEHYGHSNIIKYCNRPFLSVGEMDEKLIVNHNLVVSQEDRVIHVGDFTLKNTQTAWNYIRRLKGQHVFIMGSHDSWDKHLPHLMEFNIKEEGIYIVTCHYAMRTWPRSHLGSLLAYGHSHGRLQPFKNAWDVGVDNNNFYPIPLDDFIKKTRGVKE